MNDSAIVIDIWEARRIQASNKAATTSRAGQLLTTVDVSRILWDWVELYFQNVEPMYHEDIADFIRALMNSRAVTIYHSGSEMSALSVISVIDPDGGVRELFMREFTALIRSDGEVSSRNLRETAWWFEEHGIWVSYVPNSVHHNIRDITDEELEWYRPDRIAIVQWERKYTVTIMPESGDENLWSSFIQDFTSPSDSTLMDMIFCAFDDVTTFNWVPLENYRVHILSAEWYRESTTVVFTPEQMESIIYPRLKEIDAIYMRLSYEASWKHYFRTRVIPKLSWK